MLKKLEKKKCWCQQDSKLTLGKMTTDIMAMSLLTRKNGDTPIGNSGRAASRREQCGVSAERQNCEASRQPLLWNGSAGFTILAFSRHATLSSHVALGPASGISLSGFPTTALYAFLFYPMQATWPTHLNLLNITILMIFCKEYNLRGRVSKQVTYGYKT
jgi:hypothetical protein